MELDTFSLDQRSYFFSFRGTHNFQASNAYQFMPTSKSCTLHHVGSVTLSPINQCWFLAIYFHYSGQRTSPVFLVLTCQICAVSLSFFSFRGNAKHDFLDSWSRAGGSPCLQEPCKLDRLLQQLGCTCIGSPPVTIGHH